MIGDTYHSYMLSILWKKKKQTDKSAFSIILMMADACCCLFVLLLRPLFSNLSSVLTDWSFWSRPGSFQSATLPPDPQQAISTTCSADSLTAPQRNILYYRCTPHHIYYCSRPVLVPDLICLFIHAVHAIHTILCLRVILVGPVSCLHCLLRLVGRPVGCPVRCLVRQTYTILCISLLTHTSILLTQADPSAKER